MVKNFKNKNMIDPVTKYCILAYAYLTAAVLYIQVFRKYLSEANEKLGQASVIFNTVFSQAEEVIGLSADVLANSKFRDQMKNMVDTIKQEMNKGSDKCNLSDPLESNGYNSSIEIEEVD